MSSGFIHLHAHSEYSLLDGIARTADIATRVKELGFSAYALTDHGVMYGALEFYTGMRAAGVKPIIGCEVYVAQRKLTDKSDRIDRKSWHCVLLAQNKAGYVNLMKLTSIAHRFGYYYKPRVDIEAIRAHSDGLVCLTACPNGIVAGPFHRLSGDDEGHQRGGRDDGIPGGADVARQALENYYEIFGPERLFVEIQNHTMEIERAYAQWAADQAAGMGLRLVATNDNHYVSLDDYTAHDIALCLRDKKQLSDADRLRYNGPHYYIKTAEEMAALFPDYPEALENTAAVAGMCNLELDLGAVHFPRFEVPVEEGELFEAESDSGAGPRARQSEPKTEIPQSIEDFRVYYRRLPHWRISGATYFVTWRLHTCRSVIPEALRDLTVETLLKFAGERYQLFAYVVMDDHVHVLMRPVPGHELKDILYSWKSFTANRAQRLFEWKGPVWQDEYFDRIVRDEDELFEKLVYIQNNPLKRWPDQADYKWVSVRSPRESDFLDPALSEEAGTGPRPTKEQLPTVDTDQAKQDAYLRKLVYAGAQQRYGGVSDELRERIEYELSVIIPKGFTTYFLICADFCGFARQSGIPVGPGRGSAAGSVVAYCLEITDLDPIKYGLYFERFLNPERVELPDADIDFCFRRRDEVIEHVKRKYGADRVALIVTYSRLKARAVIKAVARAKGLEYQYSDRVTKEIQGLNPTIDEAVKGSAELRRMMADDPAIRELIEDAKRLEGIAAHHSVHAAGLVIAPDEISNYVPVQPLKDSDLLVTQYAMDYVPKAGLVKFDFLGLRNLTMIEDAAEYIRRSDDPSFDPRTIPDDDAPTYTMLQRGDGYGVFQFEAPQVKRMLIEGRPENIEDLAAINAANRPGPITSGNTQRYLENRKARVKGSSLYPSIGAILEPTGGVLLFQEQVLEIARQLGGFTLGEADLLRKAMGKKNLEVMQAQQAQFLAGAIERGVRENEAESIWEMMVQFAGYGFNKAHSVCYSWISYQTAFLKCHYPAYFMCAMLNSYMGNAAKLAEILAQCRRMQIPVLPPSVQEGGFQFTPSRDGGIIFGLGGIKGVGAGAVEGIVVQREAGGPFADLPDFFSRTKTSGVNKKVLQSLAMAGALDSLGCDRAELITNLDTIEQLCKGASNQIGIFDAFEPEDQPGVLPSRQVTPLDIALLEKEAVGLFLTHHPFADHQMYRDGRHFQLARLRADVEYNPQRWQDAELPRIGLVGLLIDVTVRTANTSSKHYAKARLEDAENSAAIIIWPKAFEQARNFVQPGAITPVVVWGKVQIPETAEEAADAWDGLEIIVEKITPYNPEGAELREAPPEPAWNKPATEPGSELPAATGSHAEPAAEPLVESEPVVQGSSPAAPGTILLEVDATATLLEDLKRLADELADNEGCEVQLLLHEPGGNTKLLQLDGRYRATLERVDELCARFSFLRAAEQQNEPQTASVQ